MPIYVNINTLIEKNANKINKDSIKNSMKDGSGKTYRQKLRELKGRE